MSVEDIEALYELSPMQQGMLFHTLYDAHAGAYFDQVSGTLRGNLDTTAFACAWQQVVARHPILRTAFYWEELDKPLQVVHRGVQLPWQLSDSRNLPLAEQEARLAAFLKADRRQGFDPSAAPLMRLALFQVADAVYQFVWSFHHMLLDGWSMPLVLSEVLACYSALIHNQQAQLGPIRPYRDYIAWLQRQDLAAAEVFWRQMLEGFGTSTPLGIDRPAARGASDATYAEQELQLSAATSAALQALARQHGLTLNTFLQGTWALLLSHYSGATDLVFGVVVAGRPPELRGVEQMIGLFINTVPLRVPVAFATPLLTWLAELQTLQAEVRQYEYSPLAQVQGWSDIPGGQPLFESIVVFENYPIIADATQGTGMGLEIADVRSLEQTNYPLTLVAAPGPPLALRVSYDDRRFDSATIARLLGHAAMLLQGMAAQPARCLAELSLLTPAERQQLLVEWNDTTVGVRGQGSGVRGQGSAGRSTVADSACLHDLVAAQAARAPDAIALVYETKDERRKTNDESAPFLLRPSSFVVQLTYHELNARANQLAHYLRALGVGPEVLVGICLERSLELVIGLLGILKAGAAYLPLDPAYPPERLAFMLDDAQVQVLITQQPMDD